MVRGSLEQRRNRVKQKNQDEKVVESESLVALTLGIIVGPGVTSSVVGVPESSPVSVHLHAIHAKKCPEDLVKFIELIVSRVPLGVMVGPVSYLLLLGTELVVAFLLLGVYQNGIRIRDFFEDLLGAWIIH